MSRFGLATPTPWNNLTGTATLTLTGGEIAALTSALVDSLLVSQAALGIPEQYGCQHEDLRCYMAILKRLQPALALAEDAAIASTRK